jgi:hypothetical protein
MLWIGIAPATFLEPSRPALEATLNRFQARVEAPPPDVATVSPMPEPVLGDRGPLEIEPPTPPDDPAAPEKETPVQIAREVTR